MRRVLTTTPTLGPPTIRSTTQSIVAVSATSATMGTKALQLDCAARLTAAEIELISIDFAGLTPYSANMRSATARSGLPFGGRIRFRVASSAGRISREVLRSCRPVTRTHWLTSPSLMVSLL